MTGNGNPMYGHYHTNDVKKFISLNNCFSMNILVNLNKLFLEYVFLFNNFTLQNNNKKYQNPKYGLKDNFIEHCIMDPWIT